MSSLTTTNLNFTGTIQAIGCVSIAVQSIEDIQSRVKEAKIAGRSLHVIGKGLSFNNIIQEDNCVLIDLHTRFNNVLSISKEKHTISVQAGITIQKLCEELAKERLALQNTPNFGGMTLGAAIATGIHGTSGRTCLDTFSSAIVELRMIDGSAQDVVLPVEHAVTLGLFGIIHMVTLKVVPLFAVQHRALHVDYPSLSEFVSDIRSDLQQNDFVMYKYLLGDCKDTLVKETFNKVDSKSDGNPLQHLVENTKTLAKYFLPANPFLTNMPWRNNIYTFLCDRDQIALSFQAMMGPPVVSEHAEIEWCIPISHLPSVLSEIEHTFAEHSQAAFFKQPIECHLRFSPDDRIPGHPAFHKRSMQPLLGIHQDKHISCAWVNLNVRQHLSNASEAFQVFEKIFMKYHGKPHWSKCWSSTGEVELYVRERDREFCMQLKKVCALYDPSMLFHRHSFGAALMVPEQEWKCRNSKEHASIQ